ncbi:hypothetical protein ACG7TL_004064 [Trametes sanguinea]
MPTRSGAPSPTPPDPTATGADPTNPSSTRSTSKEDVWELPAGSWGFIPSRPLQNEEGYPEWAIAMEGALTYATLWAVVSGSETMPPASDTARHGLWVRRDGAARAMIIRSLSAGVITQVRALKTAKAYWDTIQQQYSRTSLTSAAIWFRNLVTPLPSIHKLDEHVESYLDAVAHLKSGNFDIPESLAAGIFTSTLVDREGEPSQWNAFTAKLTITSTTTLNEVIAEARNERRRILGVKHTSAAQPDSALAAVETALATLENDARARGVKFCRFCRREGHWTSECRSKGGDSNQKKARGRKKKKGKEKSHIAQDKDRDSDSSDSADENSHLVRSEHVLYTSFSAYSPELHESTTPTLSQTETVHDDFAFVAPPRTRKSRTVIIDSGTSSHVHSHRSDFISIKPTSSCIRGFGEGKTTVAGRGEVQLLARLPDHGCTRLRLLDTCYAPNTSPSLISVSRLDDANCYTLFSQGRCVTFEMRDGGALLRNSLTRESVVLTGTKGPDRLYHLDVPSSETAYSANETHANRLQVWHGRTGHLNYASLRRMIQKGRLLGVKLSQAELTAEPPPCPSCLKGKMTRASFPPSEHSKAERILQFVSSDLWGKSQVQTPGGKRYLMTFTDHWSRWVWVAFLRHKSDAFEAFKEWLSQAERETGQKLATLRADNGGEYLSDDFRSFCRQHGIRLETTSPRTPEQNGVAERQNRSIFDRVRTILIDAEMPPRFWGEAANYIVYTKNRNPTAALKGRSPFEVRFGRPPDASFLHRFGCRAFVYDDRPGRKKLDPRAREGVFVGYAATQKAYRVLLPDKGSVVTSIHVRFNDDVNGYTAPLAEGESDYNSLFDLPSSIDDTSRPRHSSNQRDSIPGDVPAPQPPHEPPAEPAVPRRPRGRPKGSKNKKGGEPTRRSSRVALRQAPAAEPPAPAEADAPEAVDAPAVSAPAAGLGGEALSPIPDAPLSDVESELTELSDNEITALLLEHSFVAYGDEPTSYEEAMSSPEANEWHDAMIKELESIASLGSFKLTELPPGRKAIGTKWVFLKKRDTDGNVIRYKARLVAQGYTQQPGLDFTDTYAPVAKPESIRLLCALAAQRGNVIHVVDVDSAFLNSEIPEGQEAFVRQPPGFVSKEHKGLVWQLVKALYGLKQSGYLWYQKLKTIMLRIGFKVCRSDPCVFYRRDDSGRLSAITSHVDDLALFCPDLTTVNSLKSEIAQNVPIKDAGEISLLLGIKVTRSLSKRTISFSHTHKIDAALEEFGFKDVKPVSSPTVLGERLSKKHAPSSPEEVAFMRKVNYPSAVGTLMHIAVHTRPDIAKAVQNVAQFMANPGRRHWNAVKRIFQYLKGTRHYVLTFGGDGPTSPLAYCDADYGNDSDSARSISGYCILLGRGCISWSAKKQTSVALSTGEAEYYAGVHCGREILWMRQFLLELGFLPSYRTPATLLRIDSTSALRMVNNPDEISNRTKHINVAYHWIREIVQRRHITTEHVPGERNVADIFTKALPPVRHQQLTALLGVGPPVDTVR